MSTLSLDEKTRGKIRESMESLYMRLKEIDSHGEFKLESKKENSSVSIERYNWVTKWGKNNHRYCVREDGKPILRTIEFDIAFWNYFMRSR